MAFNSTILPPHPYYPIDLEMAGYLANDSDTMTLVSKFAAACIVILSTTYSVVLKVKPQISSSDLRRILWFTLSGSIHLFFEGYYAYNFRQMPSRRDLFGQLWKEYSLSDSRYQTQNSFVACMETITAVFWGPLSFLVVAMIIRNHPLRYPFQIVVSLGQLYGDVLYYATFWFEFSVLGMVHGRPEALYFWVYFVGMNGFWIVIPLVLIWKGIVACGRAFVVAEKAMEIGMGNEEVKKML